MRRGGRLPGAVSEASFDALSAEAASAAFFSSSSLLVAYVVADELLSESSVFFAPEPGTKTMATTPMMIIKSAINAHIFFLIFLTKTLLF